MKKALLAFRCIILCVSIAGLLWFIQPIFHNVLNIGNVSGICVCLVLIFATVFFGKIRKACTRSKHIRRFTVTLLAIFCLGILWSAVLTICMISVTASAPPATATVIVLGSKVSGTNPSADLWARIDAAAEYLKDNPQANCIACGGQGRGESVTEASCICDSLVKKGIDPSRVMLEEKSTTTIENIANALTIIDKEDLNSQLAIVTDEYHEFRACSIARRQGASPYAVPAKTPNYILSSCWMRELLALTKFLLIP